MHHSIDSRAYSTMNTSAYNNVGCARPTGLASPAMPPPLALRLLTKPPAGLQQTPQLHLQDPKMHTFTMARRPCVSRRAFQGGEGEDLQAVAAKLNQLIATEELTAQELRKLVVEKWERPYEVRLHRRDGKMYMQVMWKWLGQQHHHGWAVDYSLAVPAMPLQSFHLSEEQYMAQLDAVAHFINQWGVATTVRQGILGARSRGPGYTGGNGARCISIPLPVQLNGARSGEWN